MQYNDYVEFTQGLEVTKLDELLKLALEQLEAEKEVHNAEEALKKAKDNLSHISEVLIPSIVDGYSKTNFTLEIGNITISIKEKLRSSISEKNKEEAYSWLRDNGLSGIIKKKLDIEFGNDADAKLAKIESLCKNDSSVLCYKKETVNATSLSSVVKEQLAKGVNLPLTTFGVHRQKVTTIKTN